MAWAHMPALDKLERYRHDLHPTAGLSTMNAIYSSISQEVRHMTQQPHQPRDEILSGHGCSSRYLFRVAGRQESTAECHLCDVCAEESTQYALKYRPPWAEQHRELCAIVGSELSLSAVFHAMVGCESMYSAVVRKAMLCVFGFSFERKKSLVKSLQSYDNLPKS